MECLKVTVICVILCAWNSSAMSIDEIEDFKNFLEKTSHLDQVLVKKGPTPDNDIDEEESISDDAWEESGKFEGDLILNARQRKLIVADVAEGLSRNGLNDITKRWPDNELVYYIQAEHFNSDQMQAIQDGIDDLAQASCVKFRPYKKGDRDAVVIQGSRRGCFSNVGYQGGYQVLNLNGRHPPGRGCFRHGTIVHELLHSLGFYHMQSSPDRDDYIDVMWENIHEPAKHNFRKYNTFSVSDFGVEYDYDSVLHYGRRAFSRNGQDTLVPKQSGASIGQRIRLSDKDVQKLNKMYCDSESSNNDASDELAAKPTNKKDNPKNKPFQGHGIAYHQGKTIVIKLPAAETYKLTNTPKIHLFDHFSKTPEAVSQTITEGVGAAKEIVTYKYDPVLYNGKDYSVPDPYIARNDESKSKHKFRYHTYNEQGYETTSNPQTKYVKVPEINVLKHNADEDTVKNTSKLKVIEKNSTNAIAIENTTDVSDEAERDYSSKSSDVVDEAFDRLGKIIQTHVYPSQTPDLNVYKNKFDYSKFYKPEKTIDPEPKIVQVNKAYESSTITSIEKENSSAKNEENVESLEMPTKKEVYGQYKPYKTDYLPKEFDSSYGTAYPLKRMPKIKKETFVTPVYATYKHLAHKDDYSSLYHPKDKKKHTIFGYLVPLQDDKFINIDDINNDNEKYDQDAYTYSKSDDNLNGSVQLTQDDNYGHAKQNVFGRSPFRKKAYSLFGVLIPLTQKWYKIDYAPVNDSYLNESSEDYR